MDVVTTTEYPTRYAAYERPGQLVLYAGPRTGIREVAVYCREDVNPAYPTLSDGVYAEVRRIEGKGVTKPGFLVYCQATVPDRARRQRSWHEFIPCALETTGIEAARQTAERLIVAAERWVAGGGM